MNPEKETVVLARLPAGVWVLGLGSLFMDISSEMIHSLLPVFMGTVLGVSMITIGVIEGIAEATAAVAKVFSGALSDYLGKRKPLVVLGYGLAALTKPVFPLANTVTWVFAARFVDRIGKGIRGAPRDALIADITPAPQRGAAYGLRQALDSVGAFAGPLMAMLLMLWLASDIRAVMWFAVVPAFISVGLLILGLREPERDAAAGPTRKVLYREHLRRLHLDYWLVVALGGVFTLARFSEAFLVLRADDLGLSLALVPLVMIVMNLFFSVFAYPAGAAADQVGRRTLLTIGLGLLVAADLLLAYAKSPLWALAGSALWGLHMAFTQGLFAKLVADTAPAEARGTAFGIFNLISGGALLLASVLAGALWSLFGPTATFIAGAGFASLALVGLLARPMLRTRFTIKPGQR
ncbi:MAG: MFS transporter [Gammaproteobacteria bacterium]